MIKITPREKRILFVFIPFMIFIAWDSARRYWSPDVIISTENYTVCSTATEAQAKEIGQVAEMLYTAYMDFLDEFKIQAQPHNKLKIKLFKNRDEFRFCNSIRNWAEGFYREPYCYQYYSEGDANPYHWMVHEATHQLNNEVAGLDVAQWLEEGIAEYFGTSKISDGRLVCGDVDINTYPVWWLSTLATSDTLEKNIANKSVIPLRSIVSNSGGPDINKHFNLYYLHWWSLTHFLFHYENGKYKSGLVKLVTTDADLNDFEKHIGKINDIEKQWHGYVIKLKKNIYGK